MVDTNETRVQADQLLDLATRIFVSCGMRQADAHLLSDTLVEADLAGTHSHGVLRVPEYVQKLTAKGVDPQGRPAVVSDEGACLVVDGGNSMGQIGAAFAMQHVIERAKTTGIAAAAIRGSNHCGAMSYYACQALSEDMIGMATTNALPTMAPWGGAERVLGIDPVSFAIPARSELPIVYDAAFAGSSHGKIRIYKQKGLTLPDGWALDKDGQPTTDPEVAIDGLLRPIGGHKGVGLSMIMGILSSMLSGAAYNTELGNMESGPTAGMDGHFVAALRVSAFEDVDRFKARVDAAIHEIHTCRRAPGVERIYVPGEIEALNRTSYLRDGIPLNSVELADLAREPQEYGIEQSSYPWLPLG
jgi:LDH2 family malate/lactate/ureidoglycolate dehydrogenase